MKRNVRIALTGAAVAAAILVAGFILVVAFINPNDFKPEIEAAALKATGKELSLQGDLSLSVFPRLSLEAGPAEIKDDPSFGSEAFAKVEKISASVELMPLFRGKAEIGAVTVSGLRLKLAINEKGEANWALPSKTEPGGGEPAGAPKPSGEETKTADLSALALDSLEIRDTLLVYTDMRTKSNIQLAVPSFSLSSFRVGEKTALALEAAYTGPMARPITLALNADFVLPPALGQGTTFTAKGKLDETPFSCSGTAALPQTAGRQRFSLKGDLDVGAVDIDKYTATLGSAPKKTPAAPGAKPQTGNSQTAEPSLDEDIKNILNELFLDLRISIQSVTAAKVPVTDVKASVKADRGLLVAKPVAMTIAGGPVNIESSIDARGNTIRSRVTGDWKDAKVGDLLQAATGKAPLKGDLTASWGVSMTGLAWPEAAKTLEGKLAAELRNGSHPAFRLIPPGVHTLSAKTVDLTDIHASATWNIAKGIARNDDLAAKAVGLRAAGAGQVHIPDQTVHYDISVEIPTLPELPSLKVLPVVVSGPLASPSYGIDQPALLREAAKGIINAPGKTGQGLQRVGEGLGKLLGR